MTPENLKAEKALHYLMSSNKGVEYHQSPIVKDYLNMPLD